jgi:hypothetical protein
MGPEAKFYQQIKRNLKEFSFIRIENSSLLGTPDLLVYNTSGHFCTVELKVTKSKKIVKALGPLPPNTSPISMFRGSRIRELAACGLTLEACSEGLDACRLMLAQVGSKA